MPVHDWTRADDGFFHNFHGLWLAELCNTLNAGPLPSGYYAMIEQFTGGHVPDVLALSPAGRVPARGGNGVAVAEPRADRTTRLIQLNPVPRRRLMVRNNRRVVAVIEVVSPNNKNRDEKLRTFAEKVADLIRGEIHTAVIDLLPPGRFDPGGLHPVIWAALEAETPGDPAPADRPLTFAGYRAEFRPVAYLNYAAVGQPVPTVPLYLDEDVYVNLPLDETYAAVYAHLPPDLRAILG